MIASSIMRPAKGMLGKPSSSSSSDELPATEVGVEEACRKKRGVVWVEVADRPAKTAVPPGEKVAFLRLVKKRLNLFNSTAAANLKVTKQVTHQLYLMMCLILMMNSSDSTKMKNSPCKNPK